LSTTRQCTRSRIVVNSQTYDVSCANTNRDAGNNAAYIPSTMPGTTCNRPNDAATCHAYCDYWSNCRSAVWTVNNNFWLNPVSGCGSNTPSGQQTDDACMIYWNEAATAAQGNPNRGPFCWQDDDTPPYYHSGDDEILCRCRTSCGRACGGSTPYKTIDDGSSGTAEDCTNRCIRDADCTHAYWVSAERDSGAGEPDKPICYFFKRPPNECAWVQGGAQGWQCAIACRPTIGDGSAYRRRLNESAGENDDLDWFDTLGGPDTREDFMKIDIDLVSADMARNDPRLVKRLWIERELTLEDLDRREAQEREQGYTFWNDGSDEAILTPKTPEELALPHPPSPPPPPPLTTPHRRLLTGDADASGPYTVFPGDATVEGGAANVQQIVVADFDQNGWNDLFLHAPALSSGSCATRCHALGRIGYDDFLVHHHSYTKYDATDLGDASFCYCG
jgi:hypothetical protein